MRSERIVISTKASLICNLAFAVYHWALGLLSYSWWYLSLGSYFIILSVLRFSALQIKRKAASDLKLEQFTKRFSGILFLFLSVILAGTVWLSLVADRGIPYHEIAMITIALYTFTKITLAIINLYKARAADSPVIKTLRNISFADAVVSVFSLQRSMLVSFPGMAAADIRLMNCLTGIAVCLTVFILGINLIRERRCPHGKIETRKSNRPSCKSSHHRLP